MHPFLRKIYVKKMRQIFNATKCAAGKTYQIKCAAGQIF